MVHSWYFTLSLVPRCLGCGWSQGGTPVEGPSAVLGGERAEYGKGVWLYLNHSELNFPVCASVSLLGPGKVLGKSSPSQCPKYQGTVAWPFPKGVSSHHPPPPSPPRKK